MNWTLEVVVLPVSDIDRAKEFYAEKVGFNLDHDNRSGDHFRVVQLTPPGSGCSIVFGKGIAEGTPGSIPGLQLVVPDIHAARAELVRRGVDVSDVTVFDPHSGPRPATDGDDLDYMGFIFFRDPDGNSWAVQQISHRATAV
jgi:catechol 2,3-dioxygenase-like lactoylglutathione lyase family enzyme